MTDIDPRADPFPLPTDLSHRIYNGAGDDDALSRQLATRLGVKCPAQIRAIQHRHLEAPRPAAPCLALAVHEGLVAWIGREVPCPPPPCFSGKAFGFRRPAELVEALRKAIIDMRGMELQAVDRQFHTYLTPDDEKRLVQLTLHELRHLPEQALPLATTCCQMLALRYRTILNDLRRKLLELLAATAQAGTHGPLSHTYIRTVQRVLSTYAHSEFMEWLPQQLVQVATLAAHIRHDETSASRSPLVSGAFHYLNHRFTAPVSLQDVAAALHVSKEHLARVFKEETGETVVGALNRLRIEAAKEHLSSSPAALKTIAGLCGFGSLEHFQRLFKRVVGVAPGHYRRRQAKQRSH